MKKTANDIDDRSFAAKFLRGFVMDIYRENDISRLKTEIDFYLKRLECLKREIDQSSNDNWSKEAKDLLDAAKKAVEERHMYRGFSYLDSARSFLFLGIKNEDDLRAEAQAILNEAEDPDKRVSNWRKKTIKDNLYQDCKLKQPMKGEYLFNASKILFEHHHNRYIKIGRIKIILMVLAIIALSTIITLLWIVPPLGDKMIVNDVKFAIDSRFILSVVLFGIMGASISGILTVARSGAAARIPDQLIDLWILLAKLVVGAASALAMLAFVLSGILNFSIGPAQIMAISFAAGFSERLVTSAIESVTKK